MNTRKNIPSSNKLGLYIHFPYCSQRCPYCDFTLTTGQIAHQDYLEAVLLETKLRLSELVHYQWQKKTLSSLYFGGGTPGLWSTECLDAYVSFCRQTIGFDPNIEITLEANPAEISLPLLQAWSSIGINRLSLGVQSMRPEILEKLGRNHHPEEVIQVIEWSRLVGIERINIDLIHGLAGDTTQDALYDLNEVLKLNPSHISLYQLTIEPQTSFGARVRRGEQLLEPEEQLLDIYQALDKRLTQEAYSLYEVSNAALEGEESRHNLLYWTMQDYLGIGTGAHGRVNSHIPKEGSKEVDQSLRWQNIRSPKEYIKEMKQLKIRIGETSIQDLARFPLRQLTDALHLIEEERGTLDQLALDEESILVGLRLQKGLALTPSLLEKYKFNSTSLINEGLLEYIPPTKDNPYGTWKATAQGRLLLDHVCFRLILG